MKHEIRLILLMLLAFVLAAIVGCSGGGGGSDSPKSPPTADIVSPANNSSYPLGQSIAFIGTGTDPEDGSLPASAFVWASSRDGQIQAGSNSFLKSNLSVGLHIITLTVTDSAGAPNSKSINVTITAPNQSPTAEITNPANNSSHNFGQNITFTGTGTDPEDGSLPASAFVWTSSRDGQINSGSKSFSNSNLSVGSHTITLTVTDSAGATNSKSINITVTPPNQPPTAAITSPANNSSYTSGDVATFVGTGTDPEDGTLPASSFVWTSSRDGQINSGGKSFSNSNLSVGSHTITLTVTDSAGATNSKSINITVTPPNQPPTAAITSPANNSSYTSGDIVTFVGTGTDPEDGTLPASSFIWTSSRDGQINSGSKNFSKSNLSVGTHNIILTVTDSNGAIAMATCTVTINSLINYSGTYTGTFSTTGDGIEGTYTATLVLSSNLSGRLTVTGVPQDYYNSDVEVLSITDEEMLIEFQDKDGDKIRSTLNRDSDSLTGIWHYLNPAYNASGSINVSKKQTDPTFYGSLEPGDETLNNGSYVDFYTVTVETHGFLRVNMSSSNIDCFLGVFKDSDGSLVAWSDDSGGGLNAQLNLSLSPGIYIIWATSYFGGDVGNYTLTTHFDAAD